MINYKNMTEFSMIFTSEFYIFAFSAALINTVMAIIIARKFMQILQSVGYVRSEYAKWAYRRDNIYIVRLFMMVLLSTMAYLLFSIVFSYTEMDWNAYLGFVFYALFGIMYIRADFARKSKSRLVFTSRICRLLGTFAVIFFLFTLAVIFGVHSLVFLVKENQYLVLVRFGILCFMPLAIPFICDFANVINQPFERANNKKYVEKCTKTLDDATDLIKIGLTGSYGKTSVKEILFTILKVKYNVLVTPYSYNTPMGISKSVKRYDGTQDVFIAEMGARHVGDISELVNIVHPQYAIITGIGNQHLETFGTQEALLHTKYELIEGLKNGSTAVFASDNENTMRLYKRAVSEGNINAVTAGIDKKSGSRVYATNVEAGLNGCTFEIHFDETILKVSTVLIGKHNVSNILVAAALCYELGMTPQEISEGISLIKPIRHRLEVMKNERGMTIIDDSYNSNVDGTVAALEVFSGFEGRKIIVTPGLVELGKVQDLENFRFGRRIASVVDVAILIGGPNAYKIRDGLLDEGFPIEKIGIASSLSEGMKYLNEISKEGDVVLFENDLPDKFM